MNHGALADDFVEVRLRIVVENLVHLAVVERGVEPSGEPFGTSSAPPRRQGRDDAERALHARRRKANGARELGVASELGDTIGRTSRCTGEVCL